MKWSDALKDFALYLKIERGMSEHTVNNYSLDVQKLVQYLEVHDMSLSPLQITSEDIQSFIYKMAKEINPRTQSRLISGLRSFYDYLIFENYCTSNPLERIEAPKIGRKLPDTLSVNDIDRIVATIDLSSPQGERNRAIIELLYSCGLRVSELTALKISDLFFDEDFDQHAEDIYTAALDTASTEKSIEGNLEAVYKALVKKGFIPEAELELLAAWLEDVARLTA